MFGEVVIFIQRFISEKIQSAVKKFYYTTFYLVIALANDIFKILKIYELDDQVFLNISCKYLFITSIRDTIAYYGAREQWRHNLKTPGGIIHFCGYGTPVIF